MTAQSLRRVSRLAGPVGAVFALSAILVATAVSATFSWAESALSDLGVAPATALLFNGGLAVGGLVALGYSLALWTADRAVAVCYTLCAVAMILVGVFPSDTAAHYPAAVSFFLLLTLTLGVDGVRRRETTTGRVSFVLAAVSLAAWPLWWTLDVGSGIAVPEFVGAVSLAVWVVGLSPVAPLRTRVSRRRR
ncbi:DUF998 domain-containing protein [Halogeometricum limi]|uniref:Hypothetical membrane protein n=1 Tax=Halogeometricum limi TaxID=555875 RepID=A0A1I6GR72_9EURY|nr:DUF998 domain-containing protein [Halogeometricum limi]SFR44609.1 hypothetical membrane protein [Halogeometricum limi]